jgi:dTDP-D-glucose 4,6-dehydratase
MKVVYVTGCLGFIGSYITRKCLDKGWYVKGIDKGTYASNKSLLKEFKKYKNFSFVDCDINDLKFLYDCDYIINTAAETHVGNSIANSDEFVSSNINGVHNLLELIKNHRGEHSTKPILLHFSTDEVYGDIEEGEHIETDWFAVALTVRDEAGFTRADFCQFLESHKIQTRPYFAGNIMLQPAYEGIMDAEQVIKDFPVARKVTTDTFFLGCSPVTTEEQIEYIGTIVDKFMSQL